MLPSLAAGRPDCDADFKFYNPFTGRFISEGEARVVVRGMDRPIPPSHRTGWDIDDVADQFVGSNDDMRQLRVALEGCGDAVDVAAGMRKTTGSLLWNCRWSGVNCSFRQIVLLRSDFR